MRNFKTLFVSLILTFAMIFSLGVLSACDLFHTHNFENGVCTVCGRLIVVLELNEDGESYSVTGMISATETEIVIPSTHENKPVTTIGEEAFEACNSLTSVTIPDSVTSIGNSAFSHCSSLTSVTIGNSVTSIGDSAFYFCFSLTSIVIPDSVVTIGNSAFHNCTSLTSVTIGNSVTSIGDSAFLFCDSLTSVIIPDSVTTIGQGAFYYCNSLTSVTIPDSVTSIGIYAFAICTRLTQINFNGTMAQWNSVQKGIYWNNATGNYDIVCTDGTLAKNGTQIS